MNRILPDAVGNGWGFSRCPIVNGLGQGTIVGHTGPKPSEPLVHVQQYRQAVQSTVLHPPRNVHVLGLFFCNIQSGNPCQCLLRNRMIACLVQIKELAPGMGPAAKLGHARMEQGFVPAVVIDHQGALSIGWPIGWPVLKKLGGMLTTAAGLIVEHHDRRPRIQAIAAIGPKISSQIDNLGFYRPADRVAVPGFHRHAVPPAV